MQFRSEYAGLYKFEAIRLDADGNELSRRVVADWFPNLITDQGLDRLGTAGTESTWQFCRVGTSSATPTVSDTNLGSQVARTADVVSTQFGLNQDDGYIWRRNVYQFAEGAAAGVLAEVGTGWVETGSGLFSHARILDSGGNPTTVTILSDETLQVTWEVREYYPTADTSGAIVFTGNIGGTYNWTARVANLTAGGGNWVLTQAGGGLAPNLGASAHIYSDAVLGPITGLPTYSQSATISTGFSLNVYVNGSFQRTGTLTIPVGAGNFANGISGINFTSVRNGNHFQMVFSPAIMKTSNDVVTLTFGSSWGRKT